MIGLSEMNYRGERSVVLALNTYQDTTNKVTWPNPAVSHADGSPVGDLAERVAGVRHEQAHFALGTIQVDVLPCERGAHLGTTLDGHAGRRVPSRRLIAEERDLVVADSHPARSYCDGRVLPGYMTVMNCPRWAFIERRAPAVDSGGPLACCQGNEANSNSAGSAQ